MPDTERLLWHRLSRRRLVAVRALAAVDTLVFAALAVAVGTGSTSLLLMAAPTCGVLFLTLVATLAAFADRGRVSWQFVCAVLTGGPVLAALLLQLLVPPPRG